MSSKLSAFIHKYKQINLTFVDQAIVSGTNFLTGILLARFLGIEEYGRFTLIWMSILFFMSMHTALIISPMLSIAPKQEHNQKKEYYSAIFIHLTIWMFLSALILIAGCIIFGNLYPDKNVNSLILPMVIVLISFQFQDFLRRYFFSTDRAADAIFIDSMSYLGQILVLIIAFTFFKITLEITLYIIAATSFNAILWGKLKAKNLSLKTTSLMAVTKRHFHFSKWLIGTSIIEWTSGNLFMIAAGGIIGASAVGAVRATQNIIGITHIFFQACDNFIVPSAAKSFVRGGFNALIRYIINASLWGGGLMIFFFLTIALFPKFWLSLFYGDEFIQYSYLLYWWCFCYFIFLNNYFMGAFLKALEYTNVFFISGAVMSVFSLALSKYIVSNYGIQGVMAGTLINHIITFVIISSAFSIQLKKRHKIV